MIEILAFEASGQTLLIERSGFTFNGKKIAWADVTRCEEKCVHQAEDPIAFLELEIGREKVKYHRRYLPSGEAPDYDSLRVLLKVLRPDVVTLTLGSYYQNTGPEKYRWVMTMAAFLVHIGQRDEAVFAYKRAIEWLEYYHNLNHQALVTPLRQLSTILRTTNPQESLTLERRAQQIEAEPHKDKSFLETIVGATRRERKDRIKDAIENFRKSKGREPRPAEKARILKELDSGELDH